MGLYSGVDREAIWSALYALLVGKVGSRFQTMGRHHVQPPALAVEMQPALFVAQVGETRTPRPSGLPVKLTLSGFLIMYFQSPQPMLEEIGRETVLGATSVNALLRAIDDALTPDDPSRGKLTLGGLVEHCWLEGEAEIDVGLYSQQGAAILTLKMLVP